MNKPIVVEERREDGSLSVSHMNYEKSLTQQCFADMCDINKIMDRWLKGGPDPRANPDFSRYRDVSDGRSYQDALDIVLNVQSDFDSLPADVRARFRNDPAALLDFVSNPANTEESIKLGLIDDGVGSTLVGGVGGTIEVPGEQLPLDVTVRTDTALDS